MINSKQNGDVLIAMTGATIGKYAIVPLQIVQFM